MFASPFALIFRLAVLSASPSSAGTDSPRIAAYRRRCASAMFRRLAALNLGRGRVPATMVSGDVAAAGVLIPISRSADSARSMASFCSSSCAMMLSNAFTVSPAVSYADSSYLTGLGPILFT
jgi:hypothetical protein